MFTQCLLSKKMGKIALEMCATLTNVSDIKVMDNDFRWYLKLKCSNCGEESSSWQYVCLSESVETKGGRGSASMVQKCKMCGRENHLDILKDFLKPYVADKSDNFLVIVAFECRGLEPTAWDIRSGWVISSSCSSLVFDDVDLAEKEWYDYDENANETVSVTDIQHRFVKLKK